MRTGKLNQRVQINRQVRTDDGNYGQDIQWQEVATVWAEVRPLNGNETLRYQGIQAESAYMFIIRNAPGLVIDETMQFVYNGEQYNIRYRPRPDLRTHYLMVAAQRGVGQ